MQGQKELVCRDWGQTTGSPATQTETICAAEALQTSELVPDQKKQQQAASAWANISICMHAHVLNDVCLKPQHYTGKHLFQPVRSALTSAPTRPFFFFFFPSSVSEVLSESNQIPLLCLTQLRVSQKAAVDLKRRDVWGVFWNNEDHFSSAWTRNGPEPVQGPHISSHTVDFMCVYVVYVFTSSATYHGLCTLHICSYPFNKRFFV